MQILYFMNTIICATEAQQSRFSSIGNCLQNIRTQMKPALQKLSPVCKKFKDGYIFLRDKYNDFVERMYEKIMFGPEPTQLHSKTAAENYKKIIEQLKETLEKIQAGNEENLEQENEAKKEESDKQQSKEEEKTQEGEDKMEESGIKEKDKADL
ncbi:hypothetical protein CDIK_1009 [Cucumispora dikerogammari]|nr:hypothetical protein CDIK_1009 [Cucumispora dikerogammari]